MNKELKLNPNPLVQYLGKPASQFTKEDILAYVEDQGIEMINFRYVGGDGRLKSLNFVVNSLEQLDSILSVGERVDGSSLFKHIEAGSSDLYVVPRYRTAFLNPFSEIPTLDFLCSYFDKDGKPLESAPEYILHKAHEVLKERTGYSFEVMGELEYYVIRDADPLFQPEDQRGYHSASPFNKSEAFRRDAMWTIARCGGEMKYGHSEVGNFTLDGVLYEQNEIEFMPTNLEDAADQLVIAKWVLRTLAYEYGLNITFAPKIGKGKAGSGLHVHTRLMKDGKNVMIADGGLSDEAKRAIAGYLTLAPSLTAFGNTNPTSYMRLVPHQEAPTNICWGDRNRSVLVRVPLGWRGETNMTRLANPLEQGEKKDYSSKQTVEFRCPDGSANVYNLLTGLTVAARHGLEMADALEVAEKTYVDVNIFEDQHKEKMEALDHLPVSCFESAKQLERQAEAYLKYNVFPQGMIASLIEELRAFDDADLREKLEEDPQLMMHYVQKFFHCG
ncbi:MAG: glutamine synthetase [Bacteroidetes bacterium]|nr:MAG: glutamine synthetase [Bacteroidota bacterium]PIE88654.1 MAG: glutamine synthetase [Bacteroidota bacterium]